MAAPATTVHYRTLADILTGDAPIDLDDPTPDQFRVALFANSMDPGGTFDPFTDPGVYGAGVFDTAHLAAGAPSSGTGFTAPTVTAVGNRLVWGPGLTVLEVHANVTGVRALVHYHHGTGRVLSITNLGVDVDHTGGTLTLEYGPEGAFSIGGA